uniref:Cytochrome P450 n=1 Tax=Streptomyces sp. NBC_00049 TaxID=2903617 RepID=A0AAU2JWB4_9ACTN
MPGPTGLNRHLVHADPPDHTRLRTLVNAAFVPRRIARLEPLIADTANRLLDRVEQHAHVDVIADFAAPLTFRMICAILGVPVSWTTGPPGTPSWPPSPPTRNSIRAGWRTTCTPSWTPWSPASGRAASTAGRTCWAPWSAPATKAG